MKKLLLLLGVVGMLFSFSSCSKDEIKDTAGDILGDIQYANVVLNNGADTIFSQRFTIASATNVGNITTVTAASITGLPAMVIYLSSSEPGTRRIEMDADALFNMNLSGLLENTIVLSTSTDQQYIFYKGTITLDNASSANSLSGSFSGFALDRKMIQGLSVVDIFNLMANPLSINGNFKVLSISVAS